MKVSSTRTYHIKPHNKDVIGKKSLQRSILWQGNWVITKVSGHSFWHVPKNKHNRPLRLLNLINSELNSRSIKSYVTISNLDSRYRRLKSLGLFRLKFEWLIEIWFLQRIWRNSLYLRLHVFISCYLSNLINVITFCYRWVVQFLPVQRHVR